MANRKNTLIARAVHDGDARKVAVGAAVAGGAVAVAVAKLGLDRLRGDARKFRLRENEPVPDAGRRLSGARDSRVVLDTLDAVTERHPTKAPRHELLPFRRTLLSGHANAQRRLQNDDAAGEVLRELRQVRDRVPRWPLEHESIESLAPGFERIYRRGRKAYRTARKEPTTENLHELRKRSKDLWYAGQIVRPASPKRVKAISNGAKELSDLIGEDHDLALLAESADARPDRFGDEARLVELLGVIAKRRKRLRRKSMKLAADLFRKKPRAVARLIEEPAAGS